MFAKEYYKQISTLDKKIYLEFIYKYGFEIWIRPILRYINDLIWNPNFAWSSPPITWLKKKKEDILDAYLSVVLCHSLEVKIIILMEIRIFTLIFMLKALRNA